MNLHPKNIISLFGFLCFFCFRCSAQDSTDVAKEKIYLAVDELAQPQGGLETYYKWIAKNVHYPLSAAKNRIEGKVFIKFIVGRSGEITNARVVKGLDPACDEAAYRVISKSPKWIPAKVDGQPVLSYRIIPVTFKLDGQGSK